MEGILLVLALPALVQVPQRIKREKKESLRSSLFLESWQVLGSNLASETKTLSTAHPELNLDGADNIG
jgi:hypothetical protein